MSLRPQAQDIIRTWAFYTIIREHLLVNQKPWNDIMIGAYILAEDGTPMHASKGNAVDPIELLEEYGSDSMRYYATGCALGMDNPFRTKDVKRGVRLCTKLWNIESLVGSAIDGEKEFDASKVTIMDKWILSRYSKLVEEVTALMDEYQFDKSMKAIEVFLWHEFADHYLEMVKFRIYGDKDEGAQYTLYTIGLGLAKLLATFLVHITEEIYQTYFAKIDGKKSIHISEWPQTVLIDEEAIQKGELAKDIIAAVRNWKSENGLPLNSELGLVEIVAGDRKELLAGTEDNIKNTLCTKELEITKTVDIEKVPVAVKPNFARLGPEFKSNSNEIGNKLKVADAKEVLKAMEAEGYKVALDSGDEELITMGYVEFEFTVKAHGRDMETLLVDGLTILIGK
jgi:valyl-tRNA synthetase